MNIKSLKIVSFLPLLLLVGCNNANVKDEIIENFLTEASKSYTLTANEVEKVSKIDDTLMFTTEYKYKIQNVSGENARCSEMLQIEDNGEVYTQKFDIVKDINGYAATEAIDYENKVITKLLKTENGKEIYENNYINPFLLLEGSDFIKKEKGVYTLNSYKQNIFSYHLLRCQYELESIDFTFEGSNLSKINIFSKDFNGVYEDAYTGNYIPIKYRYDSQILLKDIGTTVIKGLEPVKSKNPEKEKTLLEALSKVKNNFTMIINEHDRDDKPNHEYDTVWYFDGEGKVYHQQHLGDTSRSYDLYYKKDTSRSEDKLYYHDFDSKTQTWVYVEPTYAASYNASPKTYDYFLPKNGYIAPELFDYDDAEKKYICNVEDVLGYLGNNFLPGSYAIAYFTNGMGDKCEITLKEDNTLDQITVGYSYLDTQNYVISKDFDIRFANIGTTKIPAWVEGE